MIDSVGNLYVTGYAGPNFVLARYTSTGVRDATFGDGGIVTTAVNYNASSDDFVVSGAAAADSNGRIDVALGTPSHNIVLARYNGTAPTIFSMTANPAPPGGRNFTLTVNGRNFDPGAVVLLSGVAIQTTFVSRNRLMAEVSSNAIATSGVAKVRVKSHGVISFTATLALVTRGRGRRPV